MGADGSLSLPHRGNKENCVCKFSPDTFRSICSRLWIAQLTITGSLRQHQLVWGSTFASSEGEGGRHHMALEQGQSVCWERRSAFASPGSPPTPFAFQHGVGCSAGQGGVAGRLVWLQAPLLSQWWIQQHRGEPLPPPFFCLGLGIGINSPHPLFGCFWVGWLFKGYKGLGPLGCLIFWSWKATVAGIWRYFGHFGMSGHFVCLLVAAILLGYYSGGHFVLCGCGHFNICYIVQAGSWSILSCWVFYFI